MDILRPFCRDISKYELTKYSGGVKFRNGDTIMARITPCLENGKTAKVNILEDNEIGFGSTEYIVFRAKQDITDEDFIYYLVCSPLIRDPAIKSMVGSSGRQRVQTDVLRNLEICVPDFETQCKIGSLLKSIDDKISLNTKINENLEQQAQAIFKSWFVDFEPFGGIMPDDWETQVISDLDVLITDYVANGSFKSLAQNVKYQTQETNNVLIRLTDFNNDFSSDMVYISDSAYDFLGKSKLYGDEIIISNVGVNVGTVFRCPRLNKRMSLAPNSIMLRSKSLEHYLYLYFTSPYGQQQLQSIVTGSAQPKFNKTNFRSLKILVPDNKTLLDFNAIYEPVYEMIASNNNQQHHLVTLRDTLLPKLINGEIDVSEIRV